MPILSFFRPPLSSARKQRLFAGDISVANAWQRIGESVQRSLNMRAPPSLRAMQDRLALLLDDFEASGASFSTEVTEDLAWLCKSRAEKRERKRLRLR